MNQTPGLGFREVVKTGLLLFVQSRQSWYTATLAGAEATNVNSLEQSLAAHWDHLASVKQLAPGSSAQRV